jgi:hypothetical protein
MDTRHVQHKATLALEALITFVALERLLLALRQCVPLQRLLIKEAFIAVVALEYELHATCLLSVDFSANRHTIRNSTLSSFRERL